jgi:Putative MetA-pathway of phenol degradation
MPVLFFALSPGFRDAVLAQAGSSQSINDPEFIVPARPTVSNPAEFQRPGVLQMQYGYSRNLHIPGTRAVQDNPFTLRFAASRRILFEFDLDAYTSQTPDDGMKVSSVGDSQFGIQSVLRHESDSGPGIAVSYFIKAPTASSSKGLGTGRVDHSFLFLMSRTLGRFTLDFNAVYLLAGRTSDSGYSSSGQGALAVSYALTKRLVLQGEISGFGRNDAQPGAMFVLGAVSYQVNKRLVLDAGVRFGLSQYAPSSGFIGGLTWGIANFYH